MRGRGGGGAVSRPCWQPGYSGRGPDVPPVGVKFSVLELWSLGKVFFFPTCFSSPLMGQITLPLTPYSIPSYLPGKKTLVFSERWHGECDRVLPSCFAVSDIPQYSQLVLNVCETLQEEVIALFDQTRHSLASGSATEDKDSMETDDCSRPRHKDQRDGVRACWEAVCPFHMHPTNMNC